MPVKSKVSQRSVPRDFKPSDPPDKSSCTWAYWMIAQASRDRLKLPHALTLKDAIDTLTKVIEYTPQTANLSKLAHKELIRIMESAGTW
jgi:hypothetical protein